MTLQERLAMSQGQDNGMSIILGGIPAVNQEQVQQLPVTALRPKSNHTFKVRTDSAHYAALVDSIRSSGIQTPLLVRRDPMQPGAYEIIAGHTRWTAAQELGLTTVPCIVAQLSDADADIMMAETNIQRPDWLPSERARTYKVWLEAVQTETGITQGQRTDICSLLSAGSMISVPCRGGTVHYLLERSWPWRTLKNLAERRQAPVRCGTFCAR